MRSKDAFDRVMKAVKRVREPGEKPEEDIYPMDKYICDLCQGTLNKEEIIQCGFCGRWIGKECCWNNDLKACESCSGLILLAKKGNNLEGDEEDE